MHDKMGLNNKQQEVVVVEGYHDLSVLKRLFPTMDIIITNGSEISKTTLNELRQLQSSRGLILFLDPDMQGERIRRIINDYVGETKHAFLAKDKCISKNGKKIGIEHASEADIVQALKDVKTSIRNAPINWEMSDLYRFKLVGFSQSKQLRKQITESLGIGLCNGKTLLHKLNMFNISKDQITELLEE